MGHFGSILLQRDVSSPVSNGWMSVVRKNKLIQFLVSWNKLFYVAFCHFETTRTDIGRYPYHSSAVSFFVVRTKLFFVWKLSSNNAEKILFVLFSWTNYTLDYLCIYLHMSLVFSTAEKFVVDSWLVTSPIYILRKIQVLRFMDTISSSKSPKIQQQCLISKYFEFGKSDLRRNSSRILFQFSIRTWISVTHLSLWLGNLLSRNSKVENYNYHDLAGLTVGFSAGSSLILLCLLDYDASRQVWHYVMMTYSSLIDG